MDQFDALKLQCDECITDLKQLVAAGESSGSIASLELIQSIMAILLEGFKVKSIELYEKETMAESIDCPKDYTGCVDSIPSLSELDRVRSELIESENKRFILEAELKNATAAALHREADLLSDLSSLQSEIVSLKCISLKKDIRHSEVEKERDALRADVLRLESLLVELDTDSVLPDVAVLQQTANQDFDCSLNNATADSSRVEVPVAPRVTQSSQETIRTEIETQKGQRRRNTKTNPPIFEQKIAPNPLLSHPAIPANRPVMQPTSPQMVRGGADFLLGRSPGASPLAPARMVLRVDGSRQSRRPLLSPPAPSCSGLSMSQMSAAATPLEEDVLDFCEFQQGQSGGEDRPSSATSSAAQHFSLVAAEDGAGLSKATTGVRKNTRLVQRVDAPPAPTAPTASVFSALGNLFSRQSSGDKAIKSEVSKGDDLEYLTGQTDIFEENFIPSSIPAAVEEDTSSSKAGSQWGALSSLLNFGGEKKRIPEDQDNCSVKSGVSSVRSYATQKTSRTKLSSFFDGAVANLGQASYF